MRFHVRIGVLPHEQEFAQPLEIDLTVRCTAAHVVDYRDLYSLVTLTLATDERAYLEPLAESIASKVLETTGVTSCRVAVRKPNVALGGPVAHAQVAVERSNA